VDAISHLLFGRVLSAIAPRPPCDRGVSAGIVIGSIAPDADAILMPFGWDRYLFWHQRGTHALAGTLIDAVVVAAMLRLVLRAPPVARFHHLVLAAWLGSLGHVALDLVSGGTIQLLSPFSATPFGVPWTAMADPLLAVPLVVFFVSTLRWPQHAARLGWTTMVVLLAILGTKEISRRHAMAAYARATAHGASPSSAALEAAWGSFTRWWAFDRAAGQLRTWHVDAWDGATRLVATRDTQTADRSAHTAALIDASTRLDTVRRFRSLFDLTFVDVRPNGADTDILWSDIRFCSGSACALWFGGTFAAAGAVREQVVIVGTIRQTRAP
jgi:hypothetical protein